MFRRAALVLFLLLIGTTVYGQALAPPYNVPYTLTNLGSAPGMPPNYGGLCFLNNNTLLLSGNADIAAGAIYTVPVVRGAGNHIVAFAGTSALYKNAPYIDGGLTFGPGGVLFADTYDVGNPPSANGNNLLQYKPGSPSLNPNKVIYLTPLGVNPSTGALQFVPAGFPGAGGFRILSYGQAWGAGGGQMYSANLTPDGLGTYNVGAVTLQTTLPGAPGPVGIVYVPPGSPVFNPANRYALVSEWPINQVNAYQLNVNGYPIGASKSLFLTGLTGPYGGTLDPLTNDFLFSTFQASNQVVVISGFPPPPPPPPSPPPSSPGGGSGGLGEGSYAGCDPPPSPAGDGSFGFGVGVLSLPPPARLPQAGPMLAGPYFALPGPAKTLAPASFAAAPPAGSRLLVYNVSGQGKANAAQAASGVQGALGWTVLAALALVGTVALVRRVFPASS